MLKLSAIILAAGSGSRIGTPKLKLKIDEEYFINVIIRKLISAGVKNISAVIREDYKEWCLGNVHGALFILNEEPEKGMFHSVKLGILNSKKSDGIIIFPVDYPFVETTTIVKLINSFEENSGCIIKPCYENKSGHPIIVPNKLFEFIENNNSNENLNYVIHKSKLPIQNVNVDDKGILKNINHKEDLES
jgi:molybdenum cofactor cytidylyltransferase